MEQRRRTRRRRTRKAFAINLPRKWLIVAGVAGLCVLVLLAVLLWPKNEPNSQPDVPPAADQVIHLVAGGDINITDESVAAGNLSGSYDFQKVFKDVLPILAGADVTMMNFEGVVSGNTYGSATKAAPRELLTALKNAGVDILQTANSYPLVDGHRGLVSTIQAIENVGMTPLGTYESKADFKESGGYIIWDIQGIKVAMMAFTKGMMDIKGDYMGAPAVSEDCINLLYENNDNTYQKINTDGITQVVRNAAAHDPDVMIALVHWGSELNNQISKTQKKICTLLQEEGVDAIIGTHPHYVQKMELDPETGNFVAWSLGDFYGDGETAGTEYSVLLDLEITKNGQSGETKVTGFSYTPIFVEKGEEGALRLLRINEAIAGYENRYLDRVSEETYKAMQSALSRIKSRVGS